MNDLAKTTLKIVGYLFALLVVAFTGYQSWSLLYEVSGNPYVASLGVVLFEGGMIYWWYAFQKDAEGLGQMAVSLLGAVFGLVLVGGATALHLGAINATTFGTATPARLVTIAAVVNLVLKFLYPLLHPDTFSHIWLRALEGKISFKAYRDADGKTDDIAGNLAHRIGEELARRVEVKMLTDFGLFREEAKPLALTGGAAPSLISLPNGNERSSAPTDAPPQPTWAWLNRSPGHEPPPLPDDAPPNAAWAWVNLGQGFHWVLMFPPADSASISYTPAANGVEH